MRSENPPAPAGDDLLRRTLAGATIIGTVCRNGGRLLYVTDMPVVDAGQQVDYYLALAGAARPAHERVELSSLGDPSCRWLSHKLLDPARVQAGRVRERIAAFRDAGHLAGVSVEFSCFEPSQPLEEFAGTLGLSTPQAAAVHIPLGAKHAGRALFAEAGIPMPAGSGRCRTVAELAGAVADLVRAGHRKVLVKLDSSRYAGGFGQALCDLTALFPAPGIARDVAGPSAADVAEVLSGTRPCDRETTWEQFTGEIARCGAVAEAWLGDEADVRSPSFQGRITRTGRVSVVSTHEQVYGPRRGTVTGYAFPADAAYRPTVTDYGTRIGQALVGRGVDQGDYGVDFLCVPGPAGSWRVLGCEVNLRATATKHAFLTAAGLLGTAADAEGRLVVRGGERVYESSDALMTAGGESVRPSQLIGWVTDSSLHYDPARRTGVILHMMSAAVRHGKFGAVAIGADRRHARRLLDDLQSLVTHPARRR